ncbi:MAG: DUF1987 family protein [Flavobacteriales bacterium]|nr:DUF1987 family protein [Flavobacteriales bacterium]
MRAMPSKRFHIDSTAPRPLRKSTWTLDQGVLELVGRSLPSIPENFTGAYRWPDEYLQEPKGQTTVNMRLDYLDTSSSKHLYNIFQRLNAVNERGQQVQVNWQLRGWR